MSVYLIQGGWTDLDDRRLGVFLIFRGRPWGGDLIGLWPREPWPRGRTGVGNETCFWFWFWTALCFALNPWLRLEAALTPGRGRGVEVWLRGLVAYLDATGVRASGGDVLSQNWRQHWPRSRVGGSKFHPNFLLDIRIPLELGLLGGIWTLEFPAAFRLEIG